MAQPLNYSDKYIEQVYQLWYDGGRKISQRFVNSLPPDENGSIPSFKAVEKWRDNFGWLERADVMDAEISQRFQEEAITKRIKMYEEHVDLSNKLIAKGREFLETHDIEDMGDALKSVAMGIEIQKASIGQIEMGQKILGMSNEQLTKEINKLLGKPDTTSEFIIDAETEDVSD